MARPPDSEKAKSTIVLRRIRKPGRGGASPAWKIAYADFVTALMAFFLLMWLLGSTTSGTLKGIVDHVQTPLQVALWKESGAGNSRSVVTGGGEDITPAPAGPQRHEAEAWREERVHMESLRRELESALMASPEGQRLRTHVRIELTPQGLRIQVVDDLGKPMFERGSARPDPAFAALLRVFGGVLGATGRKVVLLGHTDGAPYAGGEAGYTNWELSIDRANAARRELLAGGMDAGRVQRVVGMAAAMPLDAGDPLDPANRRISILVLDRLAEERMRRAAGEIEAGDAGRMESALEGAGSPQGSNSQSTR